MHRCLSGAPCFGLRARAAAAAASSPGTPPVICEVLTSITLSASSSTLVSLRAPVLGPGATSRGWSESPGSATRWTWAGPREGGDDGSPMCDRRAKTLNYLTTIRIHLPVPCTTLLYSQLYLYVASRGKVVPQSTCILIIKHFVMLIKK